MLQQHLIDHIQRHGPLTFEAYMNQCLYHEEHGYYSNNIANIGQSGDFSTSISIGLLFGQLLAERLYQIWQTLPRISQPWSIIEIGAFHGQLALDILNHLQKTYPQCYQTCHYSIIEPFAKLQEQQAITLNSHTCITWFKKAQQVYKKPTQGIILSNELFDALPVERLIYQNNAWNLIGIDSVNGQLSEIELPLTASPYENEINNYLKHIDFTPSDFHEIEYNPHTRSIITDIKSLITDGYQLHIDYGFAQTDLLHSNRTQGSFQAYHNHSLITNYLNMSGQADLSCHINFTQLKQALKSQGWQSTLFIDQSAYLTVNAQSWFKQISMPPTDNQQRLIKQFNTLTHPAIMGKKFWVLEATHGNLIENLDNYSSFNKIHYLNSHYTTKNQRLKSISVSVIDKTKASQR